MMENRDAKLIQEILSLKRRKNAIILAHNYQLGEIQARQGSLQYVKE